MFWLVSLDRHDDTLVFKVYPRGPLSVVPTLVVCISHSIAFVSVTFFFFWGGENIFSQNLDHKLCDAFRSNGAIFGY